MSASPQVVRKLLGDVTLFTALSPDELDALGPLFEPAALAAGEAVFRQGDVGDAMYVVAEGDLLVTVDGSPVDRLSAGAVVGEMALLTAPERNATVSAGEAGARLWRLSRGDFERLTADRPHILAAIHEVGRPRLERAQLAPLLAARFGAETDSQIASLHASTRWLRLARGEVVYRVGDPADEIYIVVSGQFEVRNAAGQVDRRVGRGAVLGEAAIVGHRVRPAEAVALRDGHLAALPVSLAAGEPRFVASVAADLMERSAKAASKSGSGGGTVVVLPATVHAPVNEIAGALAERFGAWGTTVTLSSRSVDERFGRTGVAQSAGDDEMAAPLTLWLDQQTRSYENVVLIGDTSDTPWLRRCLHFADTAFLVADVTEEPDSTRCEVVVAEAAPNLARELVLVHPDDTTLPSGTARWLDAHAVRAHHHVRLGVEADLNRLARRIGSRAVGLALSGGGARGYVHIGLFKALEERGVPVDVVYGTSMGALIGAAYSLTRDAKACERLAARFGDRKQLLDRTLPLVALTRSRKVSEILKAMFGPRTCIEDLWTPFVCVSASLTNAELRVHDRGLLWRAVRASTAIPGIFTPIMSDDGTEVLIDGGVMNNLPADLVRDFVGPATVIASNAYGGKVEGKALSFGDDISGWSVLRSKVLPFGRRVAAPSLLGTLMRSTSLASKSVMEEAWRHADLVVTYPSSQVSSLDFGHYAETIEVGYRHAAEALDAWLERADQRFEDGPRPAAREPAATASG